MKTYIRPLYFQKVNFYDHIKREIEKRIINKKEEKIQKSHVHGCGYSLSEFRNLGIPAS